MSDRPSWNGMSISPESFGGVHAVTGNLVRKPPQFQLVLKAPTTGRVHLEDMPNEITEVMEIQQLV